MSKCAFISYRRSDSSVEAHAVYDFLSRSRNVPEVFIDIDTIEPGADFRKSLDHYLSRSRVMLVLIGPEWLTTANDSGHRQLDAPTEFVRLEIATALSCGLVVIPLLVRGAEMPISAQLPDDISGITSRQAITLRDDHFEDDVRLVDKKLATHLSGQIIQRGSLIQASGAAILTAILTIALVPIIFIGMSFLSDGLLPAVSDETGNADVVVRDSETMALLRLILPVFGLVVLALFISARILEQKYANIGKLIGLVFSYSVIMTLTVGNFLTHDTLIDVNAQFAIDIILVSFSFYLLAVVWQMAATAPLMRVFKSLLIGVVVIVGILFPSIFALMFAAYKLGVVRDAGLSGSDVIVWAAAVIGGLVAIASYVGPTRD